MFARSVAILLVFIGSAEADSVRVTGTWKNFATGYSVRIPRGLKAYAGEEDGPHRGIRIVLPSGGEIVTSGEPNSLEWKNPEEGVRHTIGVLNGSACRHDVS